MKIETLFCAGLMILGIATAWTLEVCEDMKNRTKIKSLESRNVDMANEREAMRMMLIDGGILEL